MAECVSQNQQIKKYLEKSTNAAGKFILDPDAAYRNVDGEVPLDSKIKTLLCIYNLAKGFKITSKLKLVEQTESVSQFSISPDEYHFTDIHGDIFLLINHINESGIAKLNIEQPVLLYKIQDGKKLEIPFSEENLNNPEVIVVPNFEINPNFIRENQKFLFHGDLFNRGNQSMACFITMSNLIKQYNQLQSKIKNPSSCLKWVSGNHDLDFILTKDIYLREKKPYSESELAFIRNELVELNKTDNYVFCYSSPGSDILSSHTVFIEGQIAVFLDILISDPLTNESLFNIRRLDMEKLREKIKLYGEKYEGEDIETDFDFSKTETVKPGELEIRLAPEEIGILCHLLNAAFSSIITEAQLGQPLKTRTLAKLKSEIFNASSTNKGLICYKILPRDHIDLVARGIIGHNDNEEGIFFLNEKKVLCLDIGASCGFNHPGGRYKTQSVFSKVLFVKNGQCFLAIVSEKELLETAGLTTDDVFKEPTAVGPQVYILNLPKVVEQYKSHQHSSHHHSRHRHSQHEEDKAAAAELQLSQVAKQDKSHHHSSHHHSRHHHSQHKGEREKTT